MNDMIDSKATREVVLAILESICCQKWIEKDDFVDGYWTFSITPDDIRASPLYIELDGKDYADLQCGLHGYFEHPRRWNQESILSFVEAVCNGHVKEISIQTEKGKRLMTKTCVFTKMGVLECNHFVLPIALVPLPLIFGELKIVERIFMSYKDVVAGQ